MNYYSTVHACWKANGEGGEHTGGNQTKHYMLTILFLLGRLNAPLLEVGPSPPRLRVGPSHCIM